MKARSEDSSNRCTVLGVASGSDIEAANLFASFFKCLYSSNVPFCKLRKFPSRTNVRNTSSYSTVHSTGSAEVLESINTSKSARIDGELPLVLKHCAISLATHVAYIFNRSLMNRTCPSVCKTALMIFILAFWVKFSKKISLVLYKVAHLAHITPMPIMDSWRSRNQKSNQYHMTSTT